MSEMYAPIPHAVIFSRNLTDKAKVLYMYLAGRRHEREWVPQTDIADDMGWTSTTMKSHIDLLLNEGFMDKQKRDSSNANYYRLVDRGN